MGTQTHHRTELPPQDLEAMLDLPRFLDNHPEPAALLGPDGQLVPLPLALFRVLESLVAALREGKAITIAPVDQVLNTEQAADFLGISRPTLLKLLGSSEIDFERPEAGRHRRVRLQDLITYRDRRRITRRGGLDDLTHRSIVTMRPTGSGLTRATRIGNLTA